MKLLISHNHRHIYKLISYVSLFIAFSFVHNTASLAEESKQTIKELYNDARRLSQTPKKDRQAIAKYQAILEQHLANERLFQSSLRDIAKYGYIP
ncbi:MAG: hypothetical protein L3J71_05090 [Victivallaceae bacterium]|nr:hypothetical protein [Victivallaceae bacterium]